MKYVYFDASSGLSGDMILAALLDLGPSRTLFRKKMAELRLPVDLSIGETTRAGLRGLRVDVRVKKGRESGPRRWRDIEGLVQRSPFSDSVRARALAVFKILFQAEARVHGTTFPEAHLHEAGADDAIIDILGSCYLADVLDIERVYCSPLNVGRGWVKTSHGALPVPPPAVAEILKKTPVYSAWSEDELVTPTGAAIIATWTSRFIPFPEIIIKKIGYGAGTRDFKDFPNILRAFYGDEEDFQPEKKVFQIEANLDDSSPQILAHFVERALGLGALDAFLTPVVMKKGRMATKLTLLAGPDKRDILLEAVFKETTCIGIRYFAVERIALRRSIKKVKVLGEEISIKIATLGETEANAQPEFRDCLKVAEKKLLPVKVVQQLAFREYFKKRPSRHQRQRG
jgi:uncharacterized protein (TIGR00299 family) protein